MPSLWDKESLHFAFFMDFVNFALYNFQNLVEKLPDRYANDEKTIVNFKQGLIFYFDFMDYSFSGSSFHSLEWFLLVLQV